MAKVTASLYDILKSELLKRGYNEFFNGEEIVFFNDDFSFMQKILSYDPIVHEIVNDLFFFKQVLKNEESDKHFKRTFVNRFLSRQINRQTVDDFATQVVYTFMTNEQFINGLYDDLDKYLSNEHVNTTDNNGDTTSDNRSAYSELPQDEVNIDVSDTVMTTAKENTISRNKQTNNQKSKTSGESYKLDDLLKTNGLLERVFETFDRHCFLQVW